MLCLSSFFYKIFYIDFDNEFESRGLSDFGFDSELGFNLSPEFVFSNMANGYKLSRKGPED